LLRFEEGTLSRARHAGVAVAGCNARKASLLHLAMPATSGRR
jgi:hypothetical protein